MTPTGMQIPKIKARLVEDDGGGTVPPFTLTYDVIIGIPAIEPVSREFCKPQNQEPAVLEFDCWTVVMNPVTLTEPGRIEVTVTA